MHTYKQFLSKLTAGTFPFDFVSMLFDSFCLIVLVTVVSAKGRTNYDIHPRTLCNGVTVFRTRLGQPHKTSDQSLLSTTLSKIIRIDTAFDCFFYLVFRNQAESATKIGQRFINRLSSQHIFFFFILSYPSSCYNKPFLTKNLSLEFDNIRV